MSHCPLERCVVYLFHVNVLNKDRTNFGKTLKIVTYLHCFDQLNFYDNHKVRKN